MKHLLTGCTILFLVAGAASATGIAEPVDTPLPRTDPRFGGTLIIARADDPVSLDPALATRSDGTSGIDQIFENLVEFEPGTVGIRPALANGWTVSNAGQTITFSLEQDVFFHDGMPFNAEAVAFSFNRLIDRAHREEQKDISALIDQINVIDESTIEFVLSRPDASFLTYIAMDFTGIVSPEAVRRYGEDFGENPVGTGPFQFLDRVPGDQIVLQRYEDYRTRPAYLDRVVFWHVSDPKERSRMLQRGEVHMIDTPSTDDIATLRTDPHIEVSQTKGLDIGYLAMNTASEPFDDIRVRRAINAAIDREAVVSAAFPAGNGYVANSPLPSKMWREPADTDTLSYDPEYSRRLLAQAGYHNGFDTDLWLSPLGQPYLPDKRSAAETIRANLAEVGIKITIVTYDDQTIGTQLPRGEHGIVLAGVIHASGDPLAFLDYPARNVALWQNTDIAGILEQTDSTYDHQLLWTLYRRAVNVVRDEVPWIPLSHSTASVPIRVGVQGFQIYPTGRLALRDVWLSR